MHRVINFYFSFFYHSGQIHIFVLFFCRPRYRDNFLQAIRLVFLYPHHQKNHQFCFDRQVYNDKTVGCWTLNPADITQGSRFSFDAQDVKNYGFGSCIKVRYDVDCKGEAVNGFFVRPKKTHISNCDFLSLWVRGSERFGFTTKFKVGIKNVFENPEAPTDPEILVNAMIDLINKPSGQRPIRTVAGLDFGVNQVNSATDPMRRAALEAMGLSHMEGVSPSA